MHCVEVWTSNAGVTILSNKEEDTDQSVIVVLSSNEGVLDAGEFITFWKFDFFGDISSLGCNFFRFNQHTKMLLWYKNYSQLSLSLIATINCFFTFELFKSGTAFKILLSVFNCSMNTVLLLHVHNASLCLQHLTT